MTSTEGNRPTPPAPAPVTGVAAGVPYVALPPATAPGASAPVVLAWHLMDPPRTEDAMAAALPLDGLDAWRIYLGLPLSGSRMPPGGPEEVQRLGYEDAVLNLHRPVIYQAAAEFEPAFAELKRQLGLGDGHAIGVLGGSAGAAIALLVLAEGSLDISAAVLFSPVVQLREAVEATARRYDVSYAWSGPSLEVARRVDFVARADEIARRARPAVLLVVGEDDDAAGFREPAALLREALASRYDDPTRAEMIVIAGMGHAVAEEPGVEPAPQTDAAAQVDRQAVRWFERFLAS